MPTKKRTAPARRQKIEKPEIFFLALPLVGLGLVLLIVFLNSNAASGKPSPNPVPTVQAASLATPTLAVTTASVTKPATSTTVAVTSTTAPPITPNAAIGSATVTGATQIPAVTTVAATPPGGAVQTVRGTPEGSGIRLTKTEGGLKFDLLVSPGHMGDNTYSVLLSENGNRAVTDASLVRVSVTSLDMEMGVANLDLPPAGADQPGLYSAPDSKLQMLSMVGKFNIAVLVQRPGQSDVTVSFQVMVTSS